MTTNRITWYPARTPKRSGLLEHKFTVSGPNARAVRNWLLKDNTQHGEWLIPATAAAGFAFRIHENPADPEAAKRTRGRIAHLKLSGASVADMQWHEHGRA